MISVQRDLWEYLALTDRPIVLYGTGNGADKILNELEKRGIRVAGVFASDGFVRSRTFRGFEVKSYSGIKEEYPDMIVLFCFGSSRPEVMENVSRIASENEFYAPDVPVYGDNLFDRRFYEENKESLMKVREMLADEWSVKVFDDIISYKLTGDIRFLRQCETENDAEEILRLPEGAFYLDLGAFTGDTVAEFAQKHPSYRGITAVEPDKRNYRKLQKNTENTARISLARAVISDKDGTAFLAGSKGMGNHSAESGDEVPAVTVDTLLGEENGTILIKADVEGEELKMLHGAARTIAEKSPFMVIDCYHRSEDMFSLPLAVTEMNSQYRIYLRHRPYIPAWETMYFFVPVKKGE